MILVLQPRASQTLNSDCRCPHVNAALIRPISSYSTQRNGRTINGLPLVALVPRALPTAPCLNPRETRQGMEVRLQTLGTHQDFQGTVLWKTV